MKTKLTIKRIFILLLFLSCSFFTFAQNGVKISNSQGQPHSSAMLEVESTSKGMLIPRMADHTVIQSPAEGLMVFNTTDHKFWYYNGTEWKSVTTGALATGKTFQSLAGGTSIAWDYNLGFNAKVTLTGDGTLSVSNVADGDAGFIVITQDATGGRKITLPSGSIVLGGGAGAISLTSNPNATDVLSFKRMGNTFIWSAAYDAN